MICPFNLALAEMPEIEVINVMGGFQDPVGRFQDPIDIKIGAIVDFGVKSFQELKNSSVVYFINPAGIPKNTFLSKFSKYEY